MCGTRPGRSGGREIARGENGPDRVRRRQGEKHGSPKKNAVKARSSARRAVDLTRVPDLGTARGRPGASRPALRAAARPRPAPKSLEKLRFPTTRLDNPSGVAHEVHSPCGGDPCIRSPAARGSQPRTTAWQCVTRLRYRAWRSLRGRPTPSAGRIGHAPSDGRSVTRRHLAGRGAAGPGERRSRLTGRPRRVPGRPYPATAAHAPPSNYRWQQSPARGPIAPQHRAAPAPHTPDAADCCIGPNSRGDCNLVLGLEQGGLRPRRGSAGRAPLTAPTHQSSLRRLPGSIGRAGGAGRGSLR